jgi:hypothetical protein
MRKIFLFVLVIVMGLTAPVYASLIEIYSNNFDGTEFFYSGVTGGLSGVTNIEGVGALPPPFSGKLLRNKSTGNPASATILTLNGLPAHYSIDIDFHFVFIDSWDSTNGTITPDYFNVVVDGSKILQITSNNASGSFKYNGSIIGDQNTNYIGSLWKDYAFDMTPEGLLFISHTASSLLIQFFASGGGWQGGEDESWGIDNLSVKVNPVPEPATMIMLCSGLIGLVGYGRKKFFKS